MKGGAAVKQKLTGMKEKRSIRKLQSASAVDGWPGWQGGNGEKSEMEFRWIPEGKSQAHGQLAEEQERSQRGGWSPQRFRNVVSRNRMAIELEESHGAPAGRDKKEQKTL